MARKTRQRKNGQGTVIPFKNKKGKILGYAAEITVGWDENGKRQKVRGQRHKERTDAEAELVKLRKQHGQGIDLTAKPQTLREYGNEFLDDYALDHRLRSVVTYRWAFDRHIAPHIGDMDVRHIRTPTLRKIVKMLLRQGLAPRSIVLVRTVLHQILEQAVEDDLLEYNPCDRAKPPEVKKQTTGKALTIDQIAALIEAARGERLDVALRIKFSFGLRRGEVCGLRRKDVDLERGVLTVNGTLGYVVGYGLVWGPVKSDSGQGRAYKLPASLVAALTWYLTRLDAERKAMGDKWKTPANDDEDYMFVAVRSGGPINPNQLYSAFKRSAKAAGLEGYRPHDLRHSAASFLHAQRAPKKTISVFMGHANTRITDDIYTHLFQDELNEAAELIDQGLEAALERRRKMGGSSL